MRRYRYTFLDMDGRVGADLTLRWPSDKAAYEIAQKMLPQSDFSSLEMRRGAELIYHIARTDRPARESGIAGAGAADRDGRNQTLSPRQQACLAFIEGFTALEGRAPSYSEIAHCLRMKDRSGAAQLVTRLRRRKVLPFSP
jgi:LexA DNA binding domain